MKNLKMVLALLAVLALAGTSFADLTFTGNEAGAGVDVGDGLLAYTIKVSGADTFDGVWIDGQVYQANPNFGAGPLATMYADSLSVYGGAGSSVDTHFLFNAADAMKINEAMFSETNAGTNDVAGAPFNGFIHTGLGTFDLTGGTGQTGTGSLFVSTFDLEGTFDFMQVVVPAAGPAVTLNGLAVTAGGTEVMFSLPIPTPEPSTVLMLLVGSLSLLAIRRK